MEFVEGSFAAIIVKALRTTLCVHGGYLLMPKCSSCHIVCPRGKLILAFASETSWLDGPWKRDALMVVWTSGRNGPQAVRFSRMLQLCRFCG